jgi:predicted nucleotidyltransferase
MENNIIQPEVVNMLGMLEVVLKKMEFDYYLVGAIARDISLAEKFQAKRRTNDVDIALMLSNETEFNQVKQALIETGEFTAHPTESIKLFYKQAIELDLMPFGDIENESRETRLTQPRVFVMDVPGFSEIFPQTEAYSLPNAHTIKVCPIEGLVLLKLIANDDRPGRTKDITDIEHLISVYFELKDIDIYESYIDVMDIYETTNPDYLQQVSARVIGRKIRDILKDSEKLKVRVLGILDRKTIGTYWPALSDGIKDAS